jgi:hypothetical protein
VHRPGTRRRRPPKNNQHLALGAPLRALEVFDEQVLARELPVVGEVVDALPVGEVRLVELVRDPAAVFFL